MADSITVYYTSVSSDMQLKHKQTYILNILESKKIDFTVVDIAVEPEAKEKMREILENPKAIPPQLCKGDVYLGDYEAFYDAVENSELNTFLRL
ncbi:DgyrCDS12192 [Dimorphilus gyrociliatus]|uniref:DgyrCDS12192 n=1 Tax=Dimorphilus gyrociliatus TaxID=2664684 RepID=A0A7I8W6S0_9ANNE|nr:DgyrCDS12192 [Dimorphilus gyrociliatus]